MNHFCTHCGWVQLSSLLVIIICHVSLCVVVFRSVWTSKIRKEMQSVLMPEDVPSWDLWLWLRLRSHVVFFTSTTRDCLGHLALYFMEVLGFRMNYIVFGQSVSYDSIISGMSPGRSVWHRTRQCRLNRLLNQLKLLIQMMAHTIRRCLVRKKP